MSSIYASVANGILEYIKENNLQGGDKLPSERELSTRFQVSRGSVREGIRSLVNKGILISRRGDGTYVAIVQENHFGEVLANTIKGNVSSKDIFQLRYMIEPETAALAAINATADQVKNLKVMAFDMSHQAMASTDVNKLDVQFHHAIAECSGNVLLVRLVDCLTDILALSRLRAEEQEENRSIMVDKAHFAIVEAIAEGDAEAAREAMREHIRYIEIKSEEIEAQYRSSGKKS